MTLAIVVVPGTLEGGLALAGEVAAVTFEGGLALSAGVAPGTVVVSLFPFSLTIPIINKVKIYISNFEGQYAIAFKWS